MLAAIIGFTFSACDEEDDDNSAHMGSTLNLSGQVYTVNNIYEYSQYTGNISTVTSEVGGTGKVENGQLTFSVGTPNSSSMRNITNYFDEDDYTNLRISNLNANCAALWVLRGGSSTDLWKENETATMYEDVGYVYVDRDVTIRADRTVETVTYGGQTYTYTINAFTLNLKTGWNAIYGREVETSNSETFSMSADNPGHLKWTLYTW